VNGLAGLVPFALIAVVFWLLLIRPQRRRQLELASTQRGVEVGDEVVLGAGIVGRISSTEDEYLRIEVDEGVHLKVARQAVVRVLHPEDETDTEPVDETGTGATAVDPVDDPADHRLDSPVDPTEPDRDH
jgi:preprotein translocase subunit YajC